MRVGYHRRRYLRSAGLEAGCSGGGGREALFIGHAGYGVEWDKE
jgi:hypothetical protein